jgi:hypothetical protein
VSEERWNRLEQKVDAMAELLTETSTDLRRLFHPETGEFKEMKETVALHEKYFDRLKWTGTIFGTVVTAVLGYLGIHRVKL